MAESGERLVWHKVADVGELPEGRVKTVSAGSRQLALVHFQGQFTAMENRCPHQGGPLGEGSIETGTDGKCWLRCPWHGWDFDPLTGRPPGGHEDSGQTMYPVELRDEGVYVGLPPETPINLDLTELELLTLRDEVTVAAERVLRARPARSMCVP